MALNADTWKDALKPVLSAGIKGIFQQMRSGDTSKDDNWYAEQLAGLLSSAIASTGTDQIKTAGVPIGSVVVAVAGQATGTANPAEINVV